MGIGAKGADKLIKEFGSIEKIYENIDLITGKTQEKLIASKTNALHSKELIKLMHVPGITTDSIENFSIKFDGNLYDRVILEEHQFASLAKIIVDMKKVFQTPTQNRLFG